MTWNILGAHDPDLGDIASEIVALSPDVIAIQEIRHRQARRLARLLGWHHVWARKHSPYTPMVWWRAEGLAVLSPLPLTHRFAATISPGVSTWTYRHRIILAATVHRGREAIRLFCTHLASDDPDARIEQARRVAAFLRSEQRLATFDAVVAGDLNTTDDPVPVLRELRAIGLVDHGGDCTSPSIAPSQRIDYVLLPERANELGTHTPEGGERWNGLSDHLPVLVEFTLPTRQS